MQEEQAAGWDSGAAPQGNDTWNESAAAGAANWTEDGTAAVGEPEAITEEKEPEPEDKNMSYAEYVANQAAKKMENLGIKEARKPNEGAKSDKKWNNTKELNREDDQGNYMGGDDSKTGRRRERKTKAYIEIDQSFKPEPRGGGGNRGRGRGDRGDRPRGGRGEGRGSFRGSRGDGEFRGGRGRGRGRGGADGAQVNVDDQSSFPSLGAK